ncbi:phosphoadenosine phosphosulfate reductase [Streptomyces paromomycinus]|uniref:Phosphoadenosine phosphosulfate reductase n=1 Tax=Streptomyces paromomycinus TaxID=92743 RepID=A0A401WA33_STREY|nr:phosphoadenosine phosphosulfate reductase [Streptomyces paromomycinus]GCD46149.1 phosphoadenosine phosphosulfate reductase [Streptomyces paromomycinus]
MTSTIRSISYGGGVQSTALLVLAAQRRIDFPLFLMANVGDDSENPATLRYVDEYARPFAAEHGIELAVLDRVKRTGAVETLWGRLVDPRQCDRCKGAGVVHYSDTDNEDDGLPPDLDSPRTCPRCRGEGKVQSRSLPIPVRMSNGAPGTRSCTADFKIKVIAKELKRRGATPADPAIIGIGISVDEIHRANNRKVEPHEQIVYPLLELGLRRTDCARVIREAGLPVPPKSSCFFCPFHRPETWHDQRREEPELFEKSCQLEDLLNKRRATLGKDPVYLTRFGRPLREAIPDGVDLLPGFDEADGLCDSGWCMT